MNQPNKLYMTAEDLAQFFEDKDKDNVIIKSSNKHSDSFDFLDNIIRCNYYKKDEIDIIEIKGTFLCKYDHRIRLWVKLDQSTAYASGYINNKCYYSYQVTEDIFFNLSIMFPHNKLKNSP